MIINFLGGYSFLPGSTYLSFAAVAQPGYALERAIFRVPLPPVGPSIIELDARSVRADITLE